MRFHGLFKEHIGALFGKPQLVNGTRRAVGAMTKANRKGQKFGADGLGSNSVICVHTADLLNRPVGYIDWVLVRFDGPFALRPLLGGWGAPVRAVPTWCRCVTGPRTVREFAAGDWRFRLSLRLSFWLAFPSSALPDGVAWGRG
jgi:hypothetical protein